MTQDPVPDPVELRRRSADLGDRANALAAAGRVAEVPALWEAGVAAAGDPGSRAHITLAYAWYQVLHGELRHGVDLAAGLRDCGVGPVLRQIRVLIRSRWRLEPEAVDQAWRRATDTALPDWVRLTDEKIEAVGAWVSTPTWPRSRAFHDKHIARIPRQEVEAILEELALAGHAELRLAAGLHRVIPNLGAPEAYRALNDATAASDSARSAIDARDWDRLRSHATIEVLAHGRTYLGSVHAMIAETMTSPDPTPNAQAASRLSALASSATAEDRERAAADLAAVGDGPAAGLLDRRA